MKDEAPTLAIKLNNCASNDPCVLCGKRADPEVGPELFLEGTWALVCYECGDKHAPELVNLIMLGRPMLEGVVTTASDTDDGEYWDEDGFWVFSRQTESSPVQSNDPEIPPYPGTIHSRWPFQTCGTSIYPGAHQSQKGR
jgi:hypothetical protein